MRLKSCFQVLLPLFVALSDHVVLASNPSIAIPYGLSLTFKEHLSSTTSTLNYQDVRRVRERASHILDGIAPGSLEILQHLGAQDQRKRQHQLKLQEHFVSELMASFPINEKNTMRIKLSRHVTIIPLDSYSLNLAHINFIADPRDWRIFAMRKGRDWKGDKCALDLLRAVAKLLLSDYQESYSDMSRESFEEIFQRRTLTGGGQRWFDFKPAIGDLEGSSALEFARKEYQRLRQSFRSSTQSQSDCKLIQTDFNDRSTRGPSTTSCSSETESQPMDKEYNLRHVGASILNGDKDGFEKDDGLSNGLQNGHIHADDSQSCSSCSNNNKNKNGRHPQPLLDMKQKSQNRGFQTGHSLDMSSEEVKEEPEITEASTDDQSHKSAVIPASRIDDDTRDYLVNRLEEFIETSSRNVTYFFSRKLVLSSNGVPTLDDHISVVDTRELGLHPINRDITVVKWVRGDGFIGKKYFARRHTKETLMLARLTGQLSGAHTNGDYWNNGKPKTSEEIERLRHVPVYTLGFESAENLASWNWPGASGRSEESVFGYGELSGVMLGDRAYGVIPHGSSVMSARSWFRDRSVRPIEVGEYDTHWDPLDEDNTRRVWTVVDPAVSVARLASSVGAAGNMVSQVYIKGEDCSGKTLGACGGYILNRLADTDWACSGPVRKCCEFIMWSMKGDRGHLNGSSGADLEMGSCQSANAHQHGAHNPAQKTGRKDEKKPLMYDIKLK